MKNQLFRKTALDQVSSPERLSDYIRVSSVSVFVILGALTLFMCAVIVWCVRGHLSESVTIQGIVFPFKGTEAVTLPVDGTVRELFVSRGQAVHAGDRLAVVGVDQQYSLLSSPMEGVVLAAKERTASFAAYEPIVSLLRQDSLRRGRELIAYTTFDNLRKLRIGMPVQVSPADLPREKYGYIKGTIVGVDDYPVSKSEALETLRVEAFANDIFPERATFPVRILLESDPERPGGLAWSHARAGEPVEVGTGTFCSIQIIVKRLPVYKKLFEEIDNTIRKTVLWVE